jgi:dipeptidase E
MSKRLLLFSNSTMVGEQYLEYTKPYLKDFLGTNIKRLAFVPYAAVTITWDEYENRVAKAFGDIGYEVFSLHHEKYPIEALNNADAIIVGGGNTFKLVHDLHHTGLMKAIREKAEQGMPFIGWSAGSNVAGPTLRTTNDMPIIYPPSFDCMDLVPFQINPHYLHGNPPGHGGETREDRIKEFIELNPELYVVGLREGTLLRVEGNSMKLLGNKEARIFKKGMEFYELDNMADFSFLLK